MKTLSDFEEKDIFNIRVLKNEYSIEKLAELFDTSEEIIEIILEGKIFPDIRTTSRDCDMI